MYEKEKQKSLNLLKKRRIELKEQLIMKKIEYNRQRMCKIDEDVVNDTRARDLYRCSSKSRVNE